jgi:trans-aconitate methyltransferase
MKPKHLHLDLPSTTVKRRKVLKNKYFLHKTYKDFYIQLLNNLLPENKQGKIIELGSGAGFIKEIIPNAITSDVLKIPGVDKPSEFLQTASELFKWIKKHFKPKNTSKYPPIPNMEGILISERVFDWMHTEKGNLSELVREDVKKRNVA